MGTTPNYGWNTPVVDGDTDVWGDILNQTLIDIDATMKSVSDGLANSLLKAQNLNDLPNKATARNNLGLGALATKAQVQDADFAGVLSVAKGGTGGNTPSAARSGLGIGSVGVENVVPVSKGGTGGTSQVAGRAGLGLGDMATQNANAVNITGGLVTAAVITATSDLKAKKDVHDLPWSALDAVNDMRGVGFTWIDENRPDIGVIAQEVQRIIPELVLDRGKLLSVSPLALCAVLIEAVKELDAKLEGRK